MRDALCDNEQEYRRFMAANPDVFDPDEKAKKPFAGLGPDVGQAAMLRLAAKHRGVRGGRSPWHAGIRASNTRCRTRNTTRSAWSMTGRESDT